MAEDDPKSLVPIGFLCNDFVACQSTLVTIRCRFTAAWAHFTPGG